jgi:hypothetical protein
MRPNLSRHALTALARSSLERTSAGAARHLDPVLFSRAAALSARPLASRPRMHALAPKRIISSAIE